MMKRITLLRRRENLSIADFRDHWAGPHAEIAKHFPGMSKYNQNRVDELVWEIGDAGYEIDGVVELWFASQQAMTSAAASSVSAQLKIDEPRFLSGLTGLLAGETWATYSAEKHKYMVLGYSKEPDIVTDAVAGWCRAAPPGDAPAEFACDRLSFGFRRERLWAEPEIPNVAFSFWFKTRRTARESIGRSRAPLKQLMKPFMKKAQMLKVDELRII